MRMVFKLRTNMYALMAYKTQKKPLYRTTEFLTTPIHTRPYEFSPKYSFNTFKRVHCVQSICNELIKVRKIKRYPPSTGKKFRLIQITEFIYRTSLFTHKF